MKKLFITIFLFLSFIFSFGFYQTLADLDGGFDGFDSSDNSDNSDNSGGSVISINTCIYNENLAIGSLLDSCKPKKVVGSKYQGFKVEGGLKTKVNNIIKNISLLIGIIAVGALVYAGFLMQVSAGEDEKIKRAKDIIKWTIIGFLGLISAGAIIYVVINFMYAIGS